MNKEIDKKTLALSATIFTALSVLWIYLYSLTGLSFDHSFNFAALSELASLKTIVLLILTGAVLAGAIETLKYFSSKKTELEMIITSLLGSLIPIIVLINLFTNKIVFVAMMLFYMVGASLIILFPHKKKSKGIFKSLKEGWHSSKKILYLLALGGFIVGMTATLSSLEERQDEFKGAIVNISSVQAGEIDIGELLDEENDSEIGLNLTKDWYEENIFNPEIVPKYNESLKESYNLTWGDLDEEYHESVLNESYTRFKESYGEGGMSENIKSTISEELGDKLQKKLSGRIMESMFDQIPLFKALLQLLPLLIGVTIGSFILLYGSLMVSPFCALINASLPNKKKLKKDNSNTEEEEKVVDKINENK